MHEQFPLHKAIAFASSSLAAVITLTDVEQLLRTIGAGLACLVAAVTLADWFCRRRGQQGDRKKET